MEYKRTYSGAVISIFEALSPTQSIYSAGSKISGASSHPPGKQQPQQHALVFGIIRVILFLLTLIAFLWTLRTLHDSLRVLNSALIGSLFYHYIEQQNVVLGVAVGHLASSSVLSLHSAAWVVLYKASLASE